MKTTELLKLKKKKKTIWPWLKKKIFLNIAQKVIIIKGGKDQNEKF